MQAHFADAVRAFQQGNLRDAERFCRQALSRDPLNPNAANLMGAIVGIGGRHDLAVEYMRKAVELAPGELGFRTNLANALMNTNAWVEADTVLSAVVNEAGELPIDENYLRLLGIVRGRRGDYNGAIQALESAAELNPESSLTHYNLGEVYRRNSDTQAALASFRRSLEIEPTANALNSIAGLLLDLGAYRESVEYLHRLFAIDPRSVSGFHNLGVAMQANGEVRQAVVAFRNAITIDPNNLRSRYQLSSLLASDGQLNAAKEVLDEIEAIDPHSNRLKFGRIQLLEFSRQHDDAMLEAQKLLAEAPDEPSAAMLMSTLLDQLDRTEEAVVSLENVSVSEEMPAELRIGIRFQLGKLYDRLARYDEAFDCYALANQEKKRDLLFPFEADKMRLRFEQLTSTYSPRRFVELPKSNVMDNRSNRPIFIIGMPRSGTSLVEQIIAQHSTVAAAGELPDIGDLFNEIHFIHEKVSGGSSVGFVLPSKDKSGGNYSDANLTKERLDEAANRYLDRISEVNGEALYVTDKMPTDFLLLGFIGILFPGATIIHCRRHPLDTCLSSYFQQFRVGNQHSYDLTDIGTFYHYYVKYMRHWKSVSDLTFFDVEYEGLTLDPEVKIKELLDICGIPFESQCLRFHESKRFVPTASYQQVRRPMYRSSVDRWKNYEHRIQPLIESLGDLAYGWDY